MRSWCSPVAGADAATDEAALDVAVWSRVTSRRVRRQRETWWFSAVRTTHAAGDGCRLTFDQPAQARANASATASSAAARSVPLAMTVRRHGSLAAP